MARTNSRFGDAGPMNVERLRQVGSTHPTVQQALGLVRAADPEGQRLLVEGIWAHEVVLATGTVIESSWVCPDVMWSGRARDLAQEVAERAQRAYRVSGRTLHRLVERDRPDGPVSVVLPRSWLPEDVELPERALVLVADALETPGNLGTLIRTLDGCAADALVVTEPRTSLLHPRVFRASHGTSLTVPSLVFPDTRVAVDWLHGQGCRVLLAVAAPDAIDYRRADWSGATAVVVGNERYGVSSAWGAYGFDAVQVPMLGRGDSLNAAVAASVLSYEARARKGGGTRWREPAPLPADR